MKNEESLHLRDFMIREDGVERLNPELGQAGFESGGKDRCSTHGASDGLIEVFGILLFAPTTDLAYASGGSLR